MQRTSTQPQALISPQKLEADGAKQTKASFAPLNPCIGCCLGAKGGAVQVSQEREGRELLRDRATHSWV